MSTTAGVSYVTPNRIKRLEMPERVATEGRSLRALERELEQATSGPDFIDATYANTHRFPPPDYALKTFTWAASGGGMTYTPYRGDPGVRSAVAANVGSLLGVTVDPNTNLALTPGTQAGLYCALSALLEHGDSVIIPDPDYITSERSARYFDTNVISVPLIWDEGEAPHLDLAALRAAAAQGAKLLMFSNPNNPSGAVFAPEHIRDIADIVRATDLFVLVDELYSRLVYDNAPFAHFIAQPGMQERTIVTIGPSKTESLSGYRIGLVVAPPEIVDRIEDVMGIASLRCPAYAQHVLTHWIADDSNYVATRITEYQHLRDKTITSLERMPGITVRRSGGSSYLFPEFSGLAATDQEIALALKRKAGIVINPGYQFGSRGKFHFRMCFAQDEGEWSRALNRMADVLTGFPVN